MPLALSRLFAPKSLVIIGGGMWGDALVRRAQEMGYSGRLWVVHPRKAEIAGVATYADLEHLPDVPDAAFIAVHRHKSVEIVRALVAIGCGGAVCFASGFAEACKEYPDGVALQQELVEAAGEMPILGPNCYGFINALERTVLWPDQHALKSCARGVAILAQSSNIAMNLTMQQRGLPVAMMMALGNQAQTTLCDVALYLLENNRITALGLYIEGIDDLVAWCRLAARAYALGKPIVALKVGASEQAQALTISHTASMAGSMTGACALLRRYGIAQVDDLPSLLEALKIAHVHGWIEGTRLASMSCSGGEASLIADTAAAQNLHFPPLPDDVENTLQRILGDAVARANPLDYHTYIWGEAEPLRAMFAAMLSVDWSLAMLILDLPRAGLDAAGWNTALASFEAAHRVYPDTPAAVLSSLPENMPEATAQWLIERGIVPLSGFREAMNAVSALQRPTPYFSPPARGRGHDLPIRTFDEAAAKRALGHAGIAVPHGRVAHNQAQLYQYSMTLAFPQVLKGLGVAHKTEAGAVVLNLRDASMVCDAAAQMDQASYLLEEMVPDVVCELLVGITEDAAHGYVLTLGAGGQESEILCDTAIVLIPASRTELEEALQSLHCSAKLRGYRGKPGVDWTALMCTLEALQQLVLAAEGRIVELEINPLLCTAEKVWAADALWREREIS